MNDNNYLFFLNKLLFLILFFKKDGFAFRYPMNIFFDNLISSDDLLIYWENYNKEDGKIQLYIHSIYCDTRCNYCDCESLLKINENDSNLYKKYILSELDKYSKCIDKGLDSIYFGGGTFNLMSDEDIIELCENIKTKFGFNKNLIWQVEIHPYYLGKNTLKILKSYGVTDIMLGIQTTSLKVNKLNNRKFDKTKLNKAIDTIIGLGFNKVSFDLMYNLPGMTNKDLIGDLEYVLGLGKKIKENGININLEINRWDISMKTQFASFFMSKGDKYKFFDLCKYYINNSKKSVKIVNKYIDEKFLGLFDTEREEIDERKIKNTAILGIGLSATSYIPGVIAYEDCSYGTWKKGNNIIKSYTLEGIDNDLSFISNNLRKGFTMNFLNNISNKSNKFRVFLKKHKNKLKIRDGLYYFDFEGDYENDLLNLYLIRNSNLELAYNNLINKWYNIGFSYEDLDNEIGTFINYYYTRNKLYG